MEKHLRADQRGGVREDPRAARRTSAGNSDWSAALVTRALGPVLLWSARREEKRLAAGKTYEPRTIVERRNWTCRWSRSRRHSLRKNNPQALDLAGVDLHALRGLAAVLLHGDLVSPRAGRTCAGVDWRHAAARSPVTVAPAGTLLSMRVPPCARSTTGGISTGPLPHRDIAMLHL